MKLFSIVSLMLSAKISLAKISSLDRLLRPALTQQDDWFLNFDRLFNLSSLDVDKPSEFLCVTVWKYELQNLNTDDTKTLTDCNMNHIVAPSYDFTFSPLLLPVSTQFQLQEEDKQGMDVAEQELTSEEVIERLQETVIMVDKLKEADVLERRLREVRDLEERLQEMDEMAEKLQEVIEEELGKEEVEKLREEEGDLEQEAERITETVLRKSVRTVEAKEEEMDELEEQIKQVFLKGLLPEEEEVEVKQDSEKEVTDKSLSDDSMSEKLRQIEKEWQDEVEEKLKSGSSDIAGTTSIVAYQKMERRTKKRVTIVEERGQKQEEMEDVQVQRSVISEERLEKERTWRRIEILEEKSEGEVTERLQAQVADKDVWFILFDRPPYKAVYKPPGTVCNCANSFRLISLISRPFTSLILFCTVYINH